MPQLLYSGLQVEMLAQLAGPAKPHQIQSQELTQPASAGVADTIRARTEPLALSLEQLQATVGWSSQQGQLCLLAPAYSLQGKQDYSAAYANLFDLHWTHELFSPSAEILFFAARSSSSADSLLRLSSNRFLCVSLNNLNTSEEALP